MMALRDGLVGAWCPSLGTSAGLLIDRSGRNNHGTLTNMDPSTDWVQSGGAGALDFDGVNDYVIAGKDVGATPAVSLGVWLYIRGTGRQTIATSAPSLSVPALFVGVTATQRIETYRGGFTTSSGSIPLNNWTHVVVTNTGAVTQYWLNGRLDSTFNQALSHGAQTQFWLGFGLNYLNGQLDDAAVWSRALTGPEIRQLYTQGRGGWLRQPRRRTYGFVAGGFKAYWARQRAGIIGGGVR